jgi:hypothetical protein
MMSLRILGNRYEGIRVCARIASSRLRSRGVAQIDLDTVHGWIVPAPGGGAVVHIDSGTDGIEIAITAEQLAAAMRGAP